VGAREVRARCCACPPASWQDALTLPILAVLQHAVTWLLPLRKTSSWARFSRTWQILRCLTGKTKSQNNPPRHCLKLSIFGGGGEEQRGTEWILVVGRTRLGQHFILEGPAQVFITRQIKCLGEGSFLERSHARTESSATLFILEHSRAGYGVVLKAGRLRTKK